MSLLKDLFFNCAYEIKYEEVGDSVNYAFVELADNSLEIYFQCTNSKIDWIRNFMFKKKVYGEFKVHRGFLECYNSVRNIVLDKVYSKKYNEIKIIGYSHGGALCQLCLEDLVYHFPEMKEHIYGYAFESPRCISVKKSLRNRWENLFCTRVNNDLVTHVPPKLFGYNDLGSMIKLIGDTSLVRNNYPKCIKSHYPQVVIKALSDMIEM